MVWNHEIPMNQDESPLHGSPARSAPHFTLKMQSLLKKEMSHFFSKTAMSIVLLSSFSLSGSVGMGSHRRSALQVPLGFSETMAIPLGLCAGCGARTPLGCSWARPRRPWVPLGSLEIQIQVQIRVQMPMQIQTEMQI